MTGTVVPRGIMQASGVEAHMPASRPALVFCRAMRLQALLLTDTVQKLAIAATATGAAPQLPSWMTVENLARSVDVSSGGVALPASEVWDVLVLVRMQHQLMIQEAREALHALAIEPTCASALAQVGVYARSLGSDLLTATHLAIRPCSPATAAVLALSESIQELRLNYAHVLPEHVKLVAGAVRTSPNLHTLHVGGNNLADAGVQALAEALAGPRCGLQKVSLDDNAITDAGAQALSETLPFSRIQTLTLAWNFIKEKGVRALAEAVRHTASLESLALQANPVDADQMKPIFDEASRRRLTVCHVELGPMGLWARGPKGNDTMYTRALRTSP